MSLADLVPVALEADYRPPRLTGKASKAAKQRRWLEKNRDKFNAYRRAWWARRAK